MKMKHPLFDRLADFQDGNAWESTVVLLNDFANELERLLVENQELQKTIDNIYENAAGENI